MRARAASFWTTVDGVRLHARGARDAPTGRTPAVLVHGLAMSSRYMLPALRALGMRRPTLAPDLPGHGRSEKPREVLDIDGLARSLGRWMDEVGVGTSVLVANSMGCQIAVALAAQRPALARALVLVGPTMDARAGAVRMASRLVRDAGGESPALVVVEAYDVLKAGLGRTVREFRHALDDPVEARMRLVEAPVLVLRGTHDPIAPAGWAERLASLAPRGTFEEMPGPHVLNWSAAEPLAARVDAFVAGLEAVP